MKKPAILLVTLAMAGCANYQPTSAYPPTADVNVAQRSCNHEMIREVPVQALPVELIMLPQRNEWMRECMQAHGWAEQ